MFPLFYSKLCSWWSKHCDNTVMEAITKLYMGSHFARLLLSQCLFLVLLSSGLLLKLAFSSSPRGTWADQSPSWTLWLIPWQLVKWKLLVFVHGRMTSSGDNLLQWVTPSGSQGWSASCGVRFCTGGAWAQLPSVWSLGAQLPPIWGFRPCLGLLTAWQNYLPVNSKVAYMAPALWFHWPERTLPTLSYCQESHLAVSKMRRAQAI